MLRTRILAAATATLLALGMAAGGASPAIASDHSAAGTPCDSIGYEKPDSLNDLPNDAEGSATFDWGTITWDSPEVEVTVNDSYVVGICVKGGNTYPTESGPLFSDDNVVDGTEIDWTYSHGFGLSHLGYKLYSAASASIAFNDATCSTSQTLNVGGFVATNATFGDPVYDGANYTVVATANSGAYFPDGDDVSLDNTTKTFSGTLSPPNPELCPVATASIDFTAPTCATGEQLNEDGFMVSNAELTSSEVVDGSYTVVFTATGDALFASGPGVSDDRTTLTFTGTLDPKNEQLCVVVEASFTLPPATCEVGEDWENPSIDADAGVTWGEPEFDPETSTVSITFLATGANVFAIEVEGETTFVKTLKFTLDVADRDPELCEAPTYDIPTDPATCELGESLDEGGISAENATFVVIDDGSESGTYEIEFTADEGYRFADDQQTLTVTGELAGPNPKLCLEAIAAIAATDANCFFDSMLDEDGFTAENSTYEITVYNAETREYEVVFTAAYGYRFDTSLSGVSEDGTTRTFSGTLAAADPDGDGCVLPITDASIAFIDATCLDPQSLDEGNFVFDSELASLDSVMYDGLDYEVVFVAIGDDTQFFQDSEPVEGRTVSEDGKTLTFTGTLDGPNEELCLEAVVPPVTVVDDCFAQSYTITDVEGVTYTRTVNGLELPVSFDESDTATYEAAPFDTITVTAAPDEGYLLAEGYEAFEYTYAFDEECLPTAPVTTASVTWTQADCLGNPGSYTLTNEPGVIWTVDGVVVEGNTKYTAAVGSTPTIVASLEPASEEFPTGFGWSDAEQQTLWNLVFEAAEDCLPTLALTGASNALGGLGVIAILIMMAGTGLVVARRREAVRIQG